MSGYTVLRHSQHEGYYSPNNTANKATPYIFDTVVKSSDGRQIGMRFKGTGDREWVIIYVPSTDFTPTYNNVIKLINDNKDVSNRKVVIRENEKAKAARIVTNFFNSPSIAGNEKMTSYVKKPQYLKHSDDLDIIDVSDEVLEHKSGSSYIHTKNTSEINAKYVTSRLGNEGVEQTIDQYIPEEKKWHRLTSITYYRNIRDPRTRSILANISANTFRKDFIAENPNLRMSDEDYAKAAEDLRRLLIKIANTNKTPADWRRVDDMRHSLYTEVYDMDAYLAHHGILGMKWGVRRYQNEDGSLTAEGRKHYGSSDRYDTSTKSKTKRAIAKYGHDSYAMQRLAKKNLKKASKMYDSHDPDADMKKDQYERKAKEYQELQIKNRDKQKELRSQLADERVGKYGRGGAIAGEYGKNLLRGLGISVATLPISAISSAVLGPIGPALLSVPISALTMQSNYVAMRNIVDISDSDRIPKEEKYKK